jgi:hypothetical protein
MRRIAALALSSEAWQNISCVDPFSAAITDVVGQHRSEQWKCAAPKVVLCAWKEIREAESVIAA